MQPSRESKPSRLRSFIWPSLGFLICTTAQHFCEHCLRFLCDAPRGWHCLCCSPWGGQSSKGQCKEPLLKAPSLLGPYCHWMVPGRLEQTPGCLLSSRQTHTGQGRARVESAQWGLPRRAQLAYPLCQGPGDTRTWLCGPKSPWQLLNSARAVQMPPQTARMAVFQ